MNRLKLAGAALVFTICATSFAPASFAESSDDVETIYISNDLDGTLVDTIKDLRQVETTENLIQASDGLHQPVWGAGAFIQYQIDLTERLKNRRKSNGKRLEIKSVFFSGGLTERNNTILRSFVMKDGKTTALDHAYKVFSNDDLTPISAPPEGEAHTSSWKKKDLRKIDPNIDLSHVIHVDDIPTFVMPGQEGNVVAINPAYSHVGNYGRWLEDKRQGLVLSNPPPSRAAWAYDSQRLIYAAGLIDEAIDLSFRREDLSLRDAITLLQKTNDPKRVREIFETGKKVLSPYMTDHSRFVHSVACPGLLDALEEGLQN